MASPINLPNQNNQTDELFTALTHVNGFSVEEGGAHLKQLIGTIVRLFDEVYPTLHSTSDLEQMVHSAVENLEGLGAPHITSLAIKTLEILLKPNRG